MAHFCYCTSGRGGRGQVAQVFVKMANLVILSRGKDVLAEDFKFYSPGVKRIDRDAWLRVVKTLDVAFSSFTVFPTDFTVSISSCYFCFCNRSAE